MKKLIFLLSALLVGTAVSAQTHYQTTSNPETLIPVGVNSQPRKEIILPDVNGYTPYRVDFHTHTVYSDGQLKVAARMKEAWRDGLDVIALTDHMGVKMPAQSGQTTSAELKTKKGKRPQTSVNQAVKAAPGLGLLVIPGVEITGKAQTIGHYNALFTTDNHDIYDLDPIQCIRNARKQGALIMHNHPGWRRKDLEMIEFEKAVYAEKLIDGVELMNGMSFYPKMLDRAKEHKLFVTATTDIHGTTAELYSYNNHLRNMTIVFAKELSLEGMREALKAHRTLAYSFGTLAGDQQLLEDFFKASVKAKKLSENEKKKTQTVQLTNTTSLPFVFKTNGNPIQLPPLSSVIVTVRSGKPVNCTVLSMWYGVEQHPVVKLTY